MVRLQRSQIEPAAQMLARAFHNDPLCSYFIPNEVARRNLLPHIFKLRLRFGISQGEVYATSPNLEGVAVWLPDKADMTHLSMVENGVISLLPKLGIRTIYRLFLAYRFITRVRKRCTPSRYWHLSPLGVDPNSQGQGYASALLRPMLTRLDHQQLPCYIESQNEKNIGIYLHYGFRIVDNIIIPSTGIAHWCMIREPSRG